MIITCCNKLSVGPCPVIFTSRKPFNAQTLFISQQKIITLERSILLNICTVSAVFHSASVVLEGKTEPVLLHLSEQKPLTFAEEGCAFEGWTAKCKLVCN